MRLKGKHYFGEIVTLNRILFTTYLWPPAIPPISTGLIVLLAGGNPTSLMIIDPGKYFIIFLQYW